MEDSTKDLHQNEDVNQHRVEEEMCMYKKLSSSYSLNFCFLGFKYSESVQ